MNVATKQKADSSQSVLLNIEKISQSVKGDDIQVLVNAIDKEVGNRKLEKEEIEQLKAIMNVDALESAKWKSVADVLKYVSVFALAENNPGAVKKTIEVLLGVVGLFYPAANTAQGFLTKVPDHIFATMVKIGGFVSPEYMIYRGAKLIANKKAEKAKVQAEFDADVDEGVTTLIIVCKNKLLSTELDKLIKAEDDIDEDAVVGTKDGTVHTIIWNEAAWEAFRDKLTSDDKVLIIGKVKHTAPLTAEQTRFERFGVKYGWNDHIATIEADPGALSKSKNYKEFLAAMNTLQISEKQKKNAKFKFGWGTVGKLALFPPLLVGDILREDVEVKKQQLLFGLYHLYAQDLAEFLKCAQGE
ncbi:MAG: hypothetical protein E7450_03855 [Ruminococcaceae bacterium]|nr:hypothetical protein [Oscillospiraceae bacterium]